MPCCRPITDGEQPLNVDLAQGVESLLAEKYDHFIPKELLVYEYGERFIDVDGAWESAKLSTVR